MEAVSMRGRDVMEDRTVLTDSTNLNVVSIYHSLYALGSSRPTVGAIQQISDAAIHPCLSHFLILSRSLDGGIGGFPFQMQSVRG